MPATDSPAIIVARFLRANSFLETFDAFVKEAGLSPDAGVIEKGDLTIEKILEEKKVFDLSLNFERLGAREGTGWSNRAPSCPVIVRSLPTSSNLLHVSIEPSKDMDSNESYQIILATTADRRMSMLRLDSDFTLMSSDSGLQDSPILSHATIGDGVPFTIFACMSGSVIVYDHRTATIIEELRDHKKYVVKVAVCGAGRYLATAAWDGKIFLYALHLDNNSHKPLLGAPLAFLTLPTNPETIISVKDRSGTKDLLMVTRHDSTSLYFYDFPTADEPGPRPHEIRLLGSQNLAPYSNAWISFSPSAVAICPTDPTLLAVATSSIPHMKLIIVRLLVPNVKEPHVRSPEPATQTAQARNNLAIQDREDAAILISVSTLAPQTPYSTPQICWRPDGSGVWVNGDDGIIRGIEAKSGKVVATLKDGHEAGSKIRTIWAGMVNIEGGKEEWVVSGGFDKRLLVWKPRE